MIAAKKPALWVPGDWNAFFGFGTNILVNLLVLTGLLRFVVKMPDDIVFGSILPATGLMLCMSTLYYAWLAYKLAKETGRSDICALPSGVSVPHMFVVTFVMGYFAIPLAQITIFGWPLSFYMAAQGSLIVYVLIIWYYARRMGKLDQEYDVAEGD